MPEPNEHNQHPLRDKNAWKKIGNMAAFIAGSICFLFWLCNGPMRPDPTRVQHGHTWVTVPAPPETIINSPVINWVLHTGCQSMAVWLLAFALYNQLRWRKNPLKFVERKKPVPKDRHRFQYGPRDNGPSNPPPWHERVQMGMGVILMLSAGIIGCNWEWISGVYLRGPCAFLCAVGLMICMTFVGDGFDKAREDGDFDEPYNHDK